MKLSSKKTIATYWAMNSMGLGGNFMNENETVETVDTNVANGQADVELDNEDMIEPLTFDEILQDKDYQREFDRRVAKSLKTAKEKWLAELNNPKPDPIADLQKQLNEVNQNLRTEKLQSEAYKQAVGLGVEEKTIPYLLKMANFEKCVDDKGVVKGEEVKNVISKVLEDVPALKPVQRGTQGVTVGADTSNQGTPSGNLFGFNFTGVRKQ